MVQSSLKIKPKYKNSKEEMKHGTWDCYSCGCTNISLTKDVCPKCGFAEKYQELFCKNILPRIEFLKELNKPVNHLIKIKDFEEKLAQTLSDVQGVCDAQKACLHVTYVPQGHKNWCVPAALMMVLKYYKHPYGAGMCLEKFVGDIEKRCGISVDKKGVVYEDIEYYFADSDIWLINGEKHEYFIETREDLRPTMENIKKHIKNKVPLIICVKKGKKGSLNHAVVVVGCSKNYVCFHDPAEGEHLVYNKKKFSRMCDELIILTREPS